jgi:hypothetical protein
MEPLERAKKLRRLDEFRRQAPHVSASALSAILKQCSSGNIPELHSRQALASAVNFNLNEHTPYGPLLINAPVHLTDGTTGSMLFVNPLAMVWKLFKQGGSYAELLLQLFETKPSSPEQPYKLVVYADEVTPGNVLAHQNQRKIWIMYFSFLDFGGLVLQMEDAWVCSLIKRSVDVGTISGGISQIFAICLNLWFGAQTHDASTGGICLESPTGEMFRFWASLSMILQDGGAHKLVWHCKGDAGTKMCMLCRNLVSQRSKVAGEEGAELLKCSIIHEAELDFATDADIRGTIRRLAEDAVNLPKALFLLKQQACGFNHEPHGLLMDPNLMRIVKPATQFCHDWMHGVLYNGIFQTVAYLCLTSFQAAGFADLYSSISAFVELWERPHQHQHLSLALFSKKALDAHKRAGLFKCNANEALALYSVLSVFISSLIIPWGECAAEAAAYLALCDVVDLLQATSLNAVEPRRLREAVRNCLTACENAGWREHMQPKFHWMVHYALHLENFGCLPSCFVHERKHKLIKRYSNDVCNTISFERSIYGQVLSHTLNALSVPGIFALSIRLSNPQKATSAVRSILEQQLKALIHEDDCWISKEAKLANNSSCFKGDVVFLKADLGAFQVAQIWLHVCVLDLHFCLVSKWTCLDVDAVAGTVDASVSDVPTLIETSQIISPAIWSLRRSGVARVIVPFAAKV